MFPGRTTADLVRSITDVDDEAVLDPFIDPANELVTALCTASGYSDHLLQLIETWLTAHLWRVNDPAFVREEVSVIRVVREGTTDLRLQVTKYGQQVLIIDYKGNFAQLENRIKNPNNLGPRKRKIRWLFNEDS